MHFLPACIIGIAVILSLASTSTADYDILKRNEHIDEVLLSLPPILKPKKPGQSSKLGKEMNDKAKMEIPSTVGTKVETSGTPVGIPDPFAEQTTSLTSDNKATISAPKCDVIDVRLPWSRASREQRDEYLNGLVCLFNEPGVFQTGNIKSANIVEDFALVHTFTNGLLHNGSSFLPCHRHLTTTWINTLRSRCNYRGSILYGDWNTYADRGEYYTSEDIWGDDNLGSFSCPVEGGRFSNAIFRFIGANSARASKLFWHPHHLCRSPVYKTPKGYYLQDYFKSDTIRAILNQEKFADFRFELETKSHNALHFATSGDTQPSTSPYDVVWFFLQHAFFDCIWATWQNKNGGANKALYDGLHPDGVTPVTIYNTCPMMGLAKDRPVIDLLDPNAPPNCFSCAGL